MAKSLKDVLAEGKSKFGNRTRHVKAPEGKSVWRILPSVDANDPLAFFEKMGVHWVRAEAGGKPSVAHCVEVTEDKPCPVCAAIAKAEMGADEHTAEMLKEARVSRSYVVNALCIEGKDAGDTVHILQLPVGVFETQLYPAIEETLEILEPGDEGCDVVITRTGKGLNTKYSISPRMANKCKPVANSALAARHNLRDFAVGGDQTLNQNKAIAVLGELIGNHALLAKPVAAPADQQQYIASQASKPTNAIASGALKTEVDDAEVLDEDLAQDAKFLEGDTSTASPDDDLDLSSMSEEDLLAELDKIEAA